MAYTRFDEFFYMGTMEALASRVVYRQFGINRFELFMLYSLSTYLTLFEKKTAGRKALTDWLGMSYVLEKKAWAYVRGLIAKGAVNQMSWRNTPGDGNSLSISPFGGKVLTGYGMELARLEETYKTRKSKAGYEQNIISEPLPGYRMIQQGRTA